jgi:hypothetical protein
MEILFEPDRVLAAAGVGAFLFYVSAAFLRGIFGRARPRAHFPLRPPGPRASTARSVCALRIDRFFKFNLGGSNVGACVHRLACVD